MRPCPVRSAFHGGGDEEPYEITTFLIEGGEGCGFFDNDVPEFHGECHEAGNAVGHHGIAVFPGIEDFPESGGNGDPPFLIHGLVADSLEHVPTLTSIRDTNPHFSPLPRIGTPVFGVK